MGRSIGGIGRPCDEDVGELLVGGLLREAEIELDLEFTKGVLAQAQAAADARVSGVNTAHAMHAGTTLLVDGAHIAAASPTIQATAGLVAWGEDPTTGGALTDHSGNGHSLEEDFGDPTTGRASGTKYVEGYDLDGDDGVAMTAMDPALMNEQQAMLAAFELDDPTGTVSWIMALTPDGSGARGAFQYDPDQDEFRYNDKGTARVDTGVSLSAGTVYCAYAHRDGSGNLTVRVYDENGNLVVDHSSSPGTMGTGDSEAKVDFHRGGASAGDTSHFTDGGLYEARYWGGSTTPGTSTLDKIADPTDTDTENRLEGNEVAAWFLENI